jgi:predicted alpha/beta hydrolase family esterase
MASVAILNFTKEGTLVSGSLDVADDVTDVVIFSHGWHEGPSDAQRDYGTLAAAVDAVLTARPRAVPSLKIAYLGIIWPSDKYADDLTVMDMRPTLSSPPRQPGPSPILSDADLSTRAEQVAILLGTDPGALRTLALRASHDPSAQDALVTALQQASRTPMHPATDQYGFLFTSLGHKIVDGIRSGIVALKGAVLHAVEDNPLIHWLDRLRTDANAVVAHVLNIFAYNELKQRAGVVGEGVAAHVVDHLHGQGKRVHLVGHSFGARLMTSAASHAQRPVANLTLLEGAFSQNALSFDASGNIPGAYRNVIDAAKVEGRLTACHSNHDTAVWIAYPLASRVFRDSSYLVATKAVFGGPSDHYGAIGANGPQNLPATIRRVRRRSNSARESTISTAQASCPATPMCGTTAPRL